MTLLVEAPAGSTSLSPGGWAAVGNFDGLHLGHAALVRALVEVSRTAGAPAFVLSFAPHPAEVLGRGPSPARLLSQEQRLEILEAWGVRALVLRRFDAELAAMSPEDFVRDVLLGELRLRGVFVGRDFRFGQGRSGDFTTLRAALAAGDAEACEIEPVRVAGDVVSSTRIRRLVEAGEDREAAALLGRPHVIEGVVVEGSRRGRPLGFPTANLELPGRAIPARGVHACVVARGTDTWPAVANIGVRPTFDGQGVRVEVHVLGEPGDLYGATLRVAFLEHLRDEQRFPGPAALIAQIETDVEAARAVLASVDLASLRGPGF